MNIPLTTALKTVIAEPCENTQVFTSTGIEMNKRFALNQQRVLLSPYRRQNALNERFSAMENGVCCDEQKFFLKQQLTQFAKKRRIVSYQPEMKLKCQGKPSSLCKDKPVQSTQEELGPGLSVRACMYFSHKIP